MCGAPVLPIGSSGERKHVTVLVADVVGSMKLAEILDAERLREIMTELFNRSAWVVQRFQGTMERFTGDGLMALFGAPMALEDHALRACIAALEIQSVVSQMADEIRGRDNADLRLRVGLNSGTVIAGVIGTGSGTYTAIGHAVGMAQRMESAAPPGGVLCALSTARLVEHAAQLGDVLHVRVKNEDNAVPARQLIAVRAARMVVGRNEGRMVGRSTHLAELQRLFSDGESTSVTVVGAPGVGKSRLIDEFCQKVSQQHGAVVMGKCEVHTASTPFRALKRFLRSMFGVDELSDESARERVRATVWLDGDRESIDRQILFEALGIAEAGSPEIDVGVAGWRHRLVDIMVRAVQASEVPTVFVLEDAHWIDTASDLVLAEFGGALGGMSALLVVTYRPEFAGALHRNRGCEVSVGPLDHADALAHIRQLLGPEPALDDVAAGVVRLAGGNPFFAEEIVRDLGDRNVLAGNRGHYRLVGDADDLGMPVSVQSVLAARIDRLPDDMKSVLNAASVVGTRFDVEALESLVPADLSETLAGLVATEMIDQIEFAPKRRFCFRHQLIRTVAYESQLSGVRAMAHRRLAAAVETRDPTSADENAAFIAAHLEAAGDLPAACRWHLRAADWLRPRDLLAAREQWMSALHASDQLTNVDDDLALRITPRAMLLSTELFAGTDADNDVRFVELRALTARAGDLRPLATAMAGRIMAFVVDSNRAPEASALAVELECIVGELDDVPVSELEILFTAIAFAHWGNADLTGALRVIDKSFELEIEQPSLDRAVAYALRGLVEVCLGDLQEGVRHLDQATELVHGMSPVGFSSILIYWAILAQMGLHLADDRLLDIKEGLERAESFGDRWGFIAAQWCYGAVLLRADSTRRGEALMFLERAHAAISEYHLLSYGSALIGTDLAVEMARTGDRDAAIDKLRELASLPSLGAPVMNVSCPAEALCELLAARGRPQDLQEAETIVEQWTAGGPGTEATDLWTLRAQALLARSRGDLIRYTDLAQRYLQGCERLDVRVRLELARQMCRGEPVATSVPPRSG